MEDETFRSIESAGAVAPACRGAVDLGSGPSRPRDRRRGAILLMILVMIVVLSAMVIQFTEKGMTEVAIEGHYVERERLRITAYSALETALGVLADIIAVDGGLTAPGQGWYTLLDEAGFESPEGVSVKITFEDESGKLPLTSLDDATLFLLFNEMGFNNDDSLKLSQSLLDWIDPDDEARIDGAEIDLYSSNPEWAEWPYQASNQPLRRLSELAVIDGFRTLFFDELGRPNQYFQLFAANVSPYSDGELNANSVTDLAARVYAGFGDPQVSILRTYLAGADQAPGTPDDRYFANSGEIAQYLGQLPEGARLTATSRALRVRVEVAETAGEFALEAVIQPGSGRPGGLAGGGGSGARGGGGAAAAGRGASSGRTTGGAGNAQQQISYPFVFLELREDVGQNASIAAPAGEAAETAPAVETR